MIKEAADAVDRAAAQLEEQAEREIYRAAWHPIGTDLTSTVWHIRGKDLKQPAMGTYRVWAKQDHRRDKTVSARSSMSLVEIDCHGETIALLQRITYDREHRMLSSAADESAADRPVAIVPESVAEAVHRAVCTRR